MKKYLKDFTVVENLHLSNLYSLMAISPVDKAPLPPMSAGQFVEIMPPKSSGVLLRRPISIHDIDLDKNLLYLLIRRAGDGTSALMDCKHGDTINVLLPLGRGFSSPSVGDEKPLLIGGGVGVAPLLYLGKSLARTGISPVFLLGARTAGDLLREEQFANVGKLFVTTEDGSKGEKGFVTNHSILNDTWTRIYCCGPLPMMKAVARIALKKEIECEVSLENMMACGLGACLCCVENTVRGNVCVCSEGPVFNIKELLWQD